MQRDQKPWIRPWRVDFVGILKRVPVLPVSPFEQSLIWEDAMKYGFSSAGGGSRYTQTLNMLEVGSRIWVNVPRIVSAAVHAEV
jgi:hypothetical protein